MNDFKQGSSLTSFVCYLDFSVVSVCLGYLLSAPLQPGRQALDLATFEGPVFLVQSFKGTQFSLFQVSPLPEEK